MEYKVKLRKQAQEYLDRGIQAYEKEQLETAAKYIQEALQLLKKCGEDYAYVRNMNLLGVIYAILGNDGMAMDCYLEGLDYAQQNDVSVLFHLFYNNIGSRYQDLGQPHQAIGYFEMALSELEKPECLAEESHAIWWIITLVNLTDVYLQMGELDQAEKYITLVKEIMDESGEQEYYPAYLILHCRICWEQGNREEVYPCLEEVIDCLEHLDLMRDFMQNIKEAVLLLKKCKEYQRWEGLLHMVESRIKSQEAVYYHLIVTELWMDYYHTIGDQEKYLEQCVCHARLYKCQKEADNQEKAAALNMKIDIYKKEKQWHAAEEKAQIDILTGVRNRYGLEQDIRECLRDMAGNGQMLAAGILDIDDFKNINDTYGHMEGDRYLKQIGSIIESCIDGYGRAYRFGGDEFVLLIPQSGRETVERVAGNIERKLQERKLPNAKSGGKGFVTISQGYCCFYVRQEDTFGSVINRADQVLYRVKNEGKGHYAVAEEKNAEKM